MKRRRGAMKHGVRHMKQPSAMKRGCRRIEKRNRQAPQGRWLWIPFPAALPPEMGNTKQNTLMQIRNTRPGTNLHRRVLFWRLSLRTSDTAQSGGLCCILSPSCGGSAAGNGIHSHRPYTRRRTCGDTPGLSCGRAVLASTRGWGRGCILSWLNSKFAIQRLPPNRREPLRTTSSRASPR